MPGLFIPRFRPTDAIDARQIDRCVQSLADVLNGGLTAENISPYYALPASAFAENLSVYALKAFINSTTIDGTNVAVPLFGVVSYAASIVGMGYALKADCFTVNRWVEVYGGASGATLIYRHMIPQRQLPVNIGGTQYLIGFAQPRFPETLAAGSGVLRLSWPTLGGTNPVGSVTLFLSSAWQ